jgi:NAD(P)-dependent dehydrogenase (short-subunit alcohol dehydrogenase family)
MSQSAKPTIFITGAASGIGRVTAQLFASRGWFVGISDVGAAALETLKAELGPDRCSAHVLDVTDLAAFETALADFGQITGGRLDVLFNNAGISHAGWFEDVPAAAARKTVEVNLIGVMNGVYAGLPLLKQTPGARVINTGSGPAAVYGMPRIAAYSASKFGVRALSEALDLEFRRHGIRVSVILPAFVQTAMLTAPRHSGDMPGVPGKPQPPARVAEAVWRAAHGHKLHWYPMPFVRVLHALAGLAPGLVRHVVRRRTAT